jgi:CRISPR system Cascade subunit CasD
MAQALAFLLYAPLQSWGDIAVGDIRNSYRHPSKSALIGLLAAAMGLDRYRDEIKLLQLNRDLKFAIRFDGLEGPILADYHTTQVPSSKMGKAHRMRSDELRAEDLQTILSTREYLSDSAFSIFCFGPSPMLEEAKDKLTNPSRPLYLGRKSCPLAIPCIAEIIEGGDLAEIQRQFVLPKQLRELGWVPLKQSGTETCIAWEKGIASGIPTTTISRRNDNFISRTRWQFGSRAECVGYVSLP